ncbi:NtaA/DmoA family FMN-dependent monooxygenase [soil metagenome]
MSDKFHLAWFVSFVPPTWRGPWGEDTNGWMTGEYHISLIKQMERAGFDFIMFEDSTFVPDIYGGSTEAALKYPSTAPKFDPFPLLPILARETEHIGLIATGSTEFYPPYILARTMATMDHLTGGRVGWNMVTSSEDVALPNYGRDRLPPHDERYERAEEFVEIVKQLWDSWEPDAVVMDRETGRYADHTKVHAIDYVGKHHTSRGPLNMPAGPQGRPPICQAGGSEAGRAWAARHADIIVASNPIPAQMKEYRDDVRARAEKLGRDPDGIKLMWQVSPIVRETHEEAVEAHHAKYAAMSDEQIEQVLIVFSGTTEVDFSKLDLDAPVPEDLTTNGHQSSLYGFIERSRGKTLREALSVRAQLGPEIVGSPATAADRMEQIMQESGGDGFLIMQPSSRRYIDEICSGLAPELRRRGLIRDGYAHKTFRENLFDF